MLHRHRLLLPLLAALAAAGAVAAVAVGQGPSVTTEPVGVFPAPDTRSASPSTEISLRGAQPDELGTITVRGSRTGERTAEVVAHRDGRGASLVFDRPFRAERVTVTTDLQIPGARDGDFSFRTVARPREGLQSSSPPPAALLRQYFRQAGAPPEGTVPQFRSRPDLRPPEVQVRRGPRAGASTDEIFVTPKKVFGARPRGGLQSGPAILDPRGELLWFADAQGDANDLRVQQYQGRPVLSVWQGRQVLGTGEGQVVLYDESYRPIRRVSGGNGYRLDFHDTTITPEGTLLGIVYNPVDADLRSVGGPRDGRVVDGVIQEIDIETGRVLFEWHSFGNVALSESYGAVPRSRGAAYDYLHPNSVTVDTDGNLLVSARDTWTIYKLDRRTGEIIWRLGGKRSDFRMTGRTTAVPAPQGGTQRRGGSLPRRVPATQFAWQHDAQRHSDGTIRLFDNASAPPVRRASRALYLRLDEQARTATVARSVEHPDRLLSGTQANVQALENGNMFVGWGSQGYFSEFTADGRVLFDARVARGNDSYRAYRFDWTGRPRTAPAVAAQRRGSGRTAVWVSWNGATEVARWEVLAGESRDALQPVREVRRDGFETGISVPTTAAYVAVRAKDAAGEVLGQSRTVRPRRG